MNVRRLCDLGHAYVRSLADGVCPTGKTRFVSSGAAERALDLARLRAQHDGRRREQRSYHCVVCGGWHLTSVVLP